MDRSCKQSIQKALPPMFRICSVATHLQDGQGDTVNMAGGSGNSAAAEIGTSR